MLHVPMGRGLERKLQHRFAEGKIIMKWPLILQLSLFGLAMGVATVFVIPQNIEPMIWLPIFLICAYLIAKNCAAGHFLTGLLLGLVNSVWITGAHVLFFSAYITGHAREAKVVSSFSLSPKLVMVLFGPVFGLSFGLVIGIFAFIASKLVRPSATTVPIQT